MASVARRHSSARAHPLEPLRGGDLETLAGSAGRTESGAQLMAMTAGLPARLAAFVERPQATDPFAPPDARRNRFWAELERGWPLVEAYPASVALADDIATCAGDAVSLAELGSRHRTPAAITVDPLLEAGVCVVTDDKTLAWRSSADFQFFVRYRALDPAAQPVGSRRSGSIDDLRLPPPVTVTARTRTTALRAAIIDGRSTISDIAARWPHSAQTEHRTVCAWLSLKRRSPVTFTRRAPIVRPRASGFKLASRSAERSGSTLTTRHNRATAHHTAGELTHAIALFEQNLTDAVRALSPGHPMIETIRGNLERARSGEN